MKASFLTPLDQLKKKMSEFCIYKTTFYSKNVKCTSNWKNKYNYSCMKELNVLLLLEQNFENIPLTIFG